MVVTTTSFLLTGKILVTRLFEILYFHNIFPSERFTAVITPLSDGTKTALWFSTMAVGANSYPNCVSDLHIISISDALVETPITKPSIVLAYTKLLSKESPIDSLTLFAGSCFRHRTFPLS